MSGPREKPLALGEAVTLDGIVVGHSCFQECSTTYLIQFTRKGRTMEDWFHIEDLNGGSMSEGDGI